MRRLIERFFECDLNARIKHIWLTPYRLVTWHSEGFIDGVEFHKFNEPYGERTFSDE